MSPAIEQLRHRAADGNREALAVLCDHRAELGIHPGETEIMSTPVLAASLGGDVVCRECLSDGNGFGDGNDYGDSLGDGYGNGDIAYGDGFGDGQGEGDGSWDGNGYIKDYGVSGH